MTVQLTLFLLRHAKSSSADASLGDFERPLSARGLHEAAWVAETLAERAEFPTRILCSASRRTMETLAALEPVLPEGTDTRSERALYEASAEQLLGIIHDQANTEALMLIGHNPGIEELAQQLAGSGDEDVLQKLNTNVPPAGLAILRFTAESWAAIGPEAGELIAFATPER